MLLPASPLVAAVLFIEGLCRKAIAHGLRLHSESNATNLFVINQLGTQVYLTNVNPNARETNVSAGAEKLLRSAIARFEKDAVDEVNKGGGEEFETTTISVPMTPVAVRRFFISFTLMLDMALCSTSGSNFYERSFGNAKATAEGIYASSQHQASTSNQMYL